MSSSRTRWVVACAAGILLAGCDDGPPAAAPGQSNLPAKAPVPASVVPPEMVAAVSSARNSRIVSVHFVLNGTPTVNKPLPVDIAIVPHEPMGSLRATFVARDGLAVATGDELGPQTDLKPESAIAHKLIVLPNKEGVFVVSAVVETEMGGATVSRVFSIPIIVGAVDAATPPAQGPETGTPGG